MEAMKKRIFITGSTTGLGLLAGELLMKEGHEVVFHARTKSSKINPEYSYVIGDISKLEEVKSVAQDINKLGRFDVVIQNAGVYTVSSEELFAVNVRAPYVLSTLINRPERMVFLSSDMHLSGTMNLDPHTCSYSDTKLFDLMLAKWFARLWPQTYINAVDPGWVPTRMGGSSAPDDLMEGVKTQMWLATSNDPSALVTGKYFHHMKQRKSNPIADSEEAQEQLIHYLTQFVTKSHQ